MVNFITAYSGFIPESIDPGYTTPDNYKIRIHSDKGKTLVGNLPESFSLELGANWENPLSKSLAEISRNTSLKSVGKSGVLGQVIDRVGLANTADGAIKAGFDAFGKMTGLTTMSKWLTVATWVDGTGMNMTLPMEFRAFNDPIADVTDQVVRLMTMVAPGEGKAGVLIAPGPSLIGLASDGKLGGEVITVELGNFIRLSPVIVTNVSTEIKSQFDIDGNPMSATVNVSIQTPFIVTKDDIIKMFMRNSFGSGSGQSGK